ncbi:MAG: S8 family serine peptidase, partial [Bacteroidota bacterium]
MKTHRYLIYSLFVLIQLEVCAQKSYRLPSGISKEQIDEKWVILKVKDPTIPVSLIHSDQEVVIFHEVNPNRPSAVDGICKVKLKPGQDVVETITQLLQDPNILYAEPVLNYQPLFVPSDPSNATNQFYLDQISAYDAWNITKGDDDITIGVIDTGLDLDHEELSSKIWVNEDEIIDGIDNDGNGYIDDRYGYDFADNDNDPNADGSTHGSQVGGIAGGDTDNGIGMSGVGYNAKIAALKGFRTIGTTSNNLFEAVTYAVDNGIEILNLSWGSLRTGLQSEQDIIDFAVLENDVIVIAAGGNTNVDGKFYPASYDHVLSVGGTDSQDSKWSLSTYNYSIDITAPSVGIFSTSINDGYKVDQGTSFAAPMVAGTAALVKTQFRDLNALQVMERIRVTADDIYQIGNNSLYDGKLGLGRLNVYKAVSESNVKSLRATAFTTQTSKSDQLFFGDTVQVKVALTNYLNRLTNPQISISSPDNTFSVLDENVFPGSINTLKSDSIFFSILLNDDLGPETNVDIRLDIQDGAYADFQFLEALTSPDYFDFGTALKTTISGSGNLGFPTSFFRDGIGMQVNGTDILSYAGFVVGTSSATTSDNLISSYQTLSREQDFNLQKNFKLLHHPAADLYGYSEFTDLANNLVIEQSSYAWKNENALLIRYRVVNNSPSTINNLSIGFYTDFDLNNSLSNQASYEASNNYLLTKDHLNTQFTATKVIANGTPGYSAINLEDENGNTSDLTNGLFTDANKYDFLTSRLQSTAGDLGNGNNVATINGTVINQMDPYESEYFTVIIAAEDSKTLLESTLSTMTDRLNTIIDNPRVLEESFSCDGSQVTIDPADGTNFRFYEDPGGTQLITEGTSFTTGTINRDTAFYVRNIDGAYASDLFQYELTLIENVADFELSTDTLYLDNETNVVTFTDRSFRANVWNWDFGQGTQATIQNPSLTFDQVGDYDISLYIENTLDCSGTTLKKLIVANRPPAPSFQPFTICPGENITISDPVADLLKVYNDSATGEVFVKGSNLSIGPFNEDTTIHVSGTYSQLESLRVPVVVDVNEVMTDFEVEIDTTSVSNQIIAKMVNQTDTHEWVVNGLSRGNSSEIVIDNSQESVTIQLQVQNSSGCVLSSEKVFEFSSSAVPSQTDVSFCQNTPSILAPQNGSIFGFYEDEDLTQLIKKGTQLIIEEESKVFVVGLDDGLPSAPREVNISKITESITIEYTTETIQNKNRVSFSVSNHEFESFQWYVDREVVETSPNPSIFLDDNVYEVI